MLILQKNKNLHQFYKCSITGEIITPGEFYYYDTDDGIYVKFDVYQNLKKEAEYNTFDYSLVQKAQNQVEYKERMKQAEREFLAKTILNREIADQGEIKSINFELRKDKK